MKRLLTAVTLSTLGCSLVTVKQDPFPPITIKADAPAVPEPPPVEEPPERVVVTAKAIKITEKIQFAVDSAKIEAASFDLLNEIAKVMSENKHITKVQVEGHTDSDGGAKYNRKLSDKRSKSVVAYLVKAGVDEGRMVAKGFGLEKPIETNDTREGKEANRRVEFNILEQGAKMEDKAKKEEGN